MKPNEHVAAIEINVIVFGQGTEAAGVRETELTSDILLNLQVSSSPTSSPIGIKRADDHQRKQWRAMEGDKDSWGKNKIQLN